MQSKFYPALLSILLLCSGLAGAQVATKSSSTGLSFTENAGQVADAAGMLRPDILFTAHSGGAGIFLSANSISYQFRKVTYPAGFERNEKLVTDHQKQEELRSHIQVSTHRFTLSLVGAAAAPLIGKKAEQPFRQTFSGSMPARGYGRAEL